MLRSALVLVMLAFAAALWISSGLKAVDEIDFNLPAGADRGAAPIDKHLISPIDSPLWRDAHRNQRAAERRQALWMLEERVR